MCKFIYKWLVDAKASSYDLGIVKSVNTIDDYNLWNENKINGDKDSERSISFVDFRYYKTSYEGKTIVDIFYKNIHLHVSIGGKEKIYSVRIKAQDDEDLWTLRVDSNGKIDHSHPVNETYEVYVWYQLPILDITTVDGYVYRHGNWDKYVYRTMSDFFQEVNGYTLNSRFNDFYRKGGKEPKQNV